MDIEIYSPETDETIVWTVYDEEKQRKKDEQAAIEWLERLRKEGGSEIEPESKVETKEVKSAKEILEELQSELESLFATEEPVPEIEEDTPNDIPQWVLDIGKEVEETEEARKRSEANKLLAEAMKKGSEGIRFKKLLHKARSNGWRFKVRAETGTISEPVQKGDWIYSEYEPFKDELPDFVQERLRTTRNMVHVEQIIIGHEIPKIEPEEDRVIYIPKPRLVLTNNERAFVEFMAKCVVGFFKLLGYVAFGLIYAIGLIVLGIGRLLATAVTVDPVLIVVVSDGDELCWLQIAKWDEPLDS
jgi:hypothetical protein